MNPEDFECTEFDPSRFSGTVRLFPVPNLVMFPHVVQPLHVFEERYREMMDDCLEDDGLLALPILKPGWELEYASRPPIENCACLGKVVLHRKLDDGCYNLLVLGVARIKILQELDPVHSYRKARVEVVRDILPEPELSRAISLHEQLSGAIRDSCACCETPDAVNQILANEYPLCELTDLVAYALPLPCELKQSLLGELCVLRRAEMLLNHVTCSSFQFGAVSTDAPPFPLRFSDN